MPQATKKQRISDQTEAIIATFAGETFKPKHILKALAEKPELEDVGKSVRQNYVAQYLWDAVFAGEIRKVRHGHYQHCLK